MNHQEQIGVEEIGKEISAAQHCYVILKRLDPAAQDRVFNFLGSKLNDDRRKQIEWAAQKKGNVVPMPVK